ncbi:MAG: 2-C-methyl-D-erythritol 2,4-cyclodiphosphate synthase [Clostridiales bacterium]|nr:2-C-methyl-D-erythritol 2,4-cyclodiphosphate synthase [Clostridiales bacterium]
MEYGYIFAIGQDSHRFVDGKTISSDQTEVRTGQRLGGVWIVDAPALEANSDGDVILHALTNAVSGITGVNILGEKADEMCQVQGIKDSAMYLKEALVELGDRKIVHVSFSVECKTPRLAAHMNDIRLGVSKLLSLSVDSVCITATSGEGLSAFGRGEGMMVICAITVRCAKKET